jgi:hypothetical protein
LNSKNKPVASEITIKQPQAISKTFSPLVISTPLQLVSLWFWGVIDALNNSYTATHYRKLMA